MKRILALFVAFVTILFVFSGCSEDYSDYDESTIINDDILSVISMFDKETQKLILNRKSDFNSENTLLYQNEDGTYDFVIFGSPVMFRDGNKWKLISNKVVKSDEDGYAFENEANSIKTYFPLNLKNAFLVKEGRNKLSFVLNENVEDVSNGEITVFTNMYGDKVSAVCYKSETVEYYFYPTKAGIHFEVVYNKKVSDMQLDFIVNPYGKIAETGERGYVTFEKNDDRKSIIYAPLVKLNDGELSVDGKVKATDYEKSYIVSFVADSTKVNKDQAYPLHIDSTFEIYYVTIPDSSVYSKFDTNSYLRNIAVLGTHDSLGEGLEYMRIGMPALLNTEFSNLISVDMYLKSLNAPEDSASYKLYDMNEFWQSAKITWSERTTNAEFYASSKCEDSVITFDLTKFFTQKTRFDLDREASNGIMLKQVGDGNTILATSDNVMYPVVYRYKFKNINEMF